MSVFFLLFAFGDVDLMGRLPKRCQIGPVLYYGGLAVDPDSDHRRLLRLVDART